MNRTSVLERRVASATAVIALVVALLCDLAHAETPAEGAVLKGDPKHGETLYQACSACHSIDDNDIGPKHRGVVGRRAGSIADYVYSPALKASGITWSEVELNRWLTNPSALVPGTKMFYKIDDAQSRADIIAYLKEQK